MPKAELILIDNGTGTTSETRSGADGNFVFPNLQPGRYQITATFQGFNPVTIQEVVVETARSVNLVVQFEVAGLTEQVRVEGRSQVVETTSTTVANTVSNEQISKLPLAGRNILNFALLVPGSATSAGARDSEYNGLPGGAINITLDGVNNNSRAVPQRRHELLHLRPDSAGRHRRGHGLDRGADRRRRSRRRGPDPVRDQARNATPSAGRCSIRFRARS